MNKLVAFCLFVLALTIGALAAPPNVILIVSDDQHWGDYGFMGHPQIRTPNLDKLAREGLTFHRGYVTSSLCCPSLVSIITGRYPHEHRITSNDPRIPDGMPPGDFPNSECGTRGLPIEDRGIKTVAGCPLFVPNGQHVFKFFY